MTENPATRDDSSTTDHDRTDGYLVPERADPERCPHCDAPFTDEDLLALHLGVDHADALTEAERDRFETAYERESESIRLFRLKALGLLVLLYFGLLIAFSVFS